MSRIEPMGPPPPLNTEGYNSFEHGFNCDVLKEPENEFIFNQAPCEKVYRGDNNTYIVFGRDRPSVFSSGYGGLGAVKCGTIDIVAGRLSAEDASKASGSVNPSFPADASRIYISQRTLVDKNFYLAPGKSGIPGQGASAIGIKSDDVRLIARRSMKLVVGVDQKLSTGDDILSSEGVELIAKNDSSDMQPIPKGNNLKHCLEDVIKKIEQLNGIVRGFMEVQKKFNTSIANHTHISPFYGNPTSASPQLLQATADLELGMRLKVDQQLKNNVYNLQIIKTKYLTIGKQFINSSFHSLN